MKLLRVLVILLMLTGCGSVKSSDMSLSNLIEQIKVVAEIDNMVTEDLTNQAVAADYGISVQDISEGYVIHPSDGASADEVIVVRASNKDAVENVEKAIGAELVAKTEAWKNNSNEKTKIDNHIMKTIDDCVFLAIGNRSEEIEQVFNQIKQ